MLEDERKEGFKRKQIVDRVRWRIFISLLKQMPFRFINDHSGLPCVFLSEPGGSSAQVLLYGGQVISWKNEQGDELLFKSSKPTGKSPKSIKGGISICFPQLGTSGASEKQGSSRSKLWSLDNCPMHLVPTGSPSSVDLILKPTANDTIIWPCSFELRILISLSPGKLSIVPQVKNTDNRSLSFTFAVRNYLSVSDISEVRVEGLETLDYLDNLLHRERFTEQADALTFDGEVDRIYLETQTNIAIIDHEKKRTFVLRKDGLPDAVVWNPWVKATKGFSDLGDNDYKQMLCVNSGALEKPIILKPKEEWKGCQELSTVSSSYCSGQLDPQMILQWL
ncbi:putative glucose-6-phosphate 1-epimerase isoform X1 [Apium graveolens]|uniref:putative glucose-6-phosphate 1-epimerase isoform X1 n=2 Tax=Apium graveolens TaxID=4045 RepID=UPI003D78F33D